MLMFISSNLIGSTIQITTLPLPVLSTLQASGLVFNTAFATILLKEPFTRYSAIGTVLTCVGAGLIAGFGAIGEPAHNLQQLVDLLKERAFILWMSGTLLLAAITIVTAHFLKVYSSHKHIVRNWFDKLERPRSASSAGSPEGPRRAFTVMLPKPMQSRLLRLRVFRGLAYALISGILSAHSLLMAKSAVELIVRTFVDHKNQFNRYESWLILLALLFFSLSQLYYLQIGLRLCSTSILYPFVFCVYNIIAILDGLIYFKQASLLTALDAGLVALGTVILLTGVLSLSWRLDHTTSQEPISSATPGTPLAPGLGSIAVMGSQDNLHSPSRRSTSRDSMEDEITPLLTSRKRASTLRLPQTDQRDIWAELDDQENGNDILSSLPRTSSLFLRPHKRRTSRTSPALSSDSEQSDVDPISLKKPINSSANRDGRRRSSMKGARSASAGHADKTENGPSEPARKRGNTVHFEEGIRPSRFDAAGSISNWKKSKDDKPQGENG